MQTDIVTTTPRLALSLLMAVDAPWLLELLNEPGFLTWIGDRGVRNLDDARRYLEEGPWASYARHGHGLWAIRRRSDGAALGMAGLLRRDFLEGPDLGYALFAASSGQGYGREAAGAVLSWASAHGHRQVWAMVKPGNLASLRLLAALGFEAAGNVAAGPAPADLLLRKQLDRC